MPLPVSLTGLSPSLAGFPKAVLLPLADQLCGPNPGAHAPRFGLFRVRSPLLTESLVVFSSSGYLDVSVRRVPLPALWIGAGMHEGFSCGFPHSDTSGSKGICPSPKLFAAYRVFRRLLVPRHPPYALSSMTKRTAAHGRRLASYVGIALPALASRHFFYSLPRIWFVLNNRFRDYLGCLDLDILLDHFVFPCMRFSRYICDARRASSGEYEIRTRDLLLARQALSQLS